MLERPCGSQEGASMLSRRQAGFFRRERESERFLQKRGRVLKKGERVVKKILFSKTNRGWASS